MLGAVFMFSRVKQNQNPSISLAPSPVSSSIMPSLTTTAKPQEADFTASFQIITKGVARSFKNPKYHQKSPDVFILAEDSTIVHVKKIGITWNDFFKTLPMKLTKDCLMTGDGESYCNDSGGNLKFYLNDKENQDLLDTEIKDGDKALIKY